MSASQNPIARSLARCLASLCIALAAFGNGCSSLDMSKGIPWGEGKDGKFDVPMQVAAFWTDAVQSQTDKPGSRGFGGRLYFYSKDPNKPVKVKGSLVVYAFDETNRDPKNVVPDKKFVFLPDQFEKKYSKSDVGPSYSIWLPWDEVGGQQKQISLIARFTDNKGVMIASDPSKVVLPGSAPEKPAEENNGLPGILSHKLLQLPPAQPLITNTSGNGSYPVQQIGY